MLEDGKFILEYSLPNNKPKKYAITAQGFFGLYFWFTKIWYIIYTNNIVATTETNDPKLDTAFHPL